MPTKPRTADGDQIIHRGALARLEREAAAEGRHLASWPLSPTEHRLYVIRYCETADEREEVLSYVYLGLPLPASHQR